MRLCCEAARTGNPLGERERPKEPRTGAFDGKGILMTTPAPLYDMAGVTLKVGVYYWVLPEPDPNARYPFENQPQPARFVGYDAEGFALWNWIGVGSDEPGEGDETPDGGLPWDVVWVGWKVSGGQPGK